MSVKFIPIIYIPNRRLLPFVNGPKIGINQTKFGVPSYQSRMVTDVTGFQSDSVLEWQDRYKGDSHASSCNVGIGNGLDFFPRQPPAPGPFYKPEE